jgi:c-di-GMP phosphodiesterase
MEHIRIGRQPILDGSSNLCAYAIMYRENREHRYSSASLIANVLNKFGTTNLLGDKRAFITVDEKFLLHDLIFTIPGEFFIFSLSSDIEMTERVIERVEKLYKEGYLLSLEHIKLNEDIITKYEPILNRISFAKIDIRKDAPLSLKKTISHLRASGVTIVGDNIYDAIQFAKAKEFGCDWFQGYFFAELKIIENAKYEASHMHILKLYRLLMDDTNIDEITKEFENNYEITVQLLQFINSGSFHFRKKISSIHHILVLVGRIPLAQWLMLMIYSKSVSNGAERSPLMLMVKNRTELMESILKTLQPNVRSNMLGEAYFVGVLSLIDTLFGMKMEDILEQIHISEDVKNALLSGSGLLGEILTLIRKIEQFDTKAVEQFESDHNLQSGLLNDIILEGIESVQKFENPEELAS